MNRELWHVERGRSYIVGTVNLVPQGHKWFISSSPRAHILSNHPIFSKLRFSLSEYEPRIGPTGDISVYIPKKVSYGFVLKKIAQAYYEALKNPYEPHQAQQQELFKEAGK